MHNKRTARILKVFALLLPVLWFLLFFPINDLEDIRRVQDFYLEEPHSLDVVFLGASDVYAGFSPVLAYEEFGFTSYDYCPSGNFIHFLPGQIRDVLRVQSPHLLVIDIAEISMDKGSPHDTVFRKYISGTPLSRNKVQLINKYGDKDQLLSYYLPFCTNHGNTDIATIWEDTRSRHITDRRGYSLLKGTQTYTGFEENPSKEFDVPINLTNDFTKADIPPVIESNIHYLLSYCKESVEIPILFVNFPRQTTHEEAYQHAHIINSLGDVIAEYGYDFINLETQTDTIGLVHGVDFYNDEHLNLYGQYKLTRYLCSILTEQYGITGRPQTAANQSRWDTCVEYQHLYYRLFDESVSSGNRDLWMKETASLMTMLEEMKP